MKQVSVIIGSVLVLAAIVGGGIWLERQPGWVAGSANVGAVVPQSANMTQTKNNPQGGAVDLQITDIKTGDGAEAKAGQSVTVSYVGTLDDGTQFDANQSFNFTLGVGWVLKGWDEGVVGMKVGGERNLVIPPALGYGDHTAGSIPPNSTLHFTVTLLDVQ